MVEIGGLIAPEAGSHDVRVEFFEAGGGAGLIVSYQGPGVEKQPIPNAAWSHGESCPADITGDGAVNVDDLIVLLASWGTCGLQCDADVNVDLAVNVDDLLIVINAFGACP